MNSNSFLNPKKNKFSFQIFDKNIFLELFSWSSLYNNIFKAMKCVLHV